VRQFFGWLQKRTIEIGILYRLTGDSSYAHSVHKTLRHFVRNYHNYPLANNLLGPTRLFQSSFLEAFWLADMVIAYDLTRDAPVYSALDHQEIKELFLESCNLIRSFDEKRSNRQAFYNVGMGAVGLLYEDSELIEHVLAGPHGFAFHMRDSVLEDGMWYEGETYHFASLDHLLDLAEMARHRGIDLYHGGSGYGSLKPMFDAPLNVMYPNLTFPSRKDSWFGRGIAYHKEIYELGYARYGEARYGQLLDHAYRSGANRDELGWRAFLFLAPELPGGQVEHLRPRDSRRMPGTGIAVLRRDEGASAVSLEYGRYGGGHGHPDRLHLNYFSDDVLWLLDPGTGYYHVPELAWYRSTLAHNTVTVDGASQERQEGTLTAFADLGHLQAVQADVKEIYPGVSMRRTLVHCSGFLLDVIDVRSADEHSYDWSMHTRADVHLSSEAMKGLQPTAGALGEGNGYEFLRDLIYLGHAPLEARLSEGNANLYVRQLGSFDRYRSQTLGIPLQEDKPFNSLIARQTARGTSFVTCFLHQSLKNAEFVSADGGYALQADGIMHQIHLDHEPGVAHLTTRNGALQTLEVFGRTTLQAEGVSYESHWRLPYAAIIIREHELEVSLPEDFGCVQLTVSTLTSATRVLGLPDGATATSDGAILTLTQKQAIRVWLEDEQETIELHAGCESRFRFQLANYQHDARTPNLALPDGYALLDLTLVRNKNPQTWEAVVRPATEAHDATAVAKVLVDGSVFEFPIKLLPPLRAEWRILSEGGQPCAQLVIRELRGVPTNVTGEITDNWSGTRCTSIRLKLEPRQYKLVRVPLPLTATPALPAGLAGDEGPVMPPPHGTWTLPGLTDTAGTHQLQALLEVEDFRGTSQAKLPLCWCSPDHCKVGSSEDAVIRLGTPEQAYWAEQPYEDIVDCSAYASLAWTEDGLHLDCDVHDDVHVADANKDDLYENDSIQLYLDFRESHHQRSNFSPDVAAFVLAPDSEKRTLRVGMISGSKEISNRQAQATWFTTEGIRTSCQPTATGYRATAFFPYASLGVAPPAAGDVIGFDLAVSDNDGTWYRKFQLVWSGARGRRCYIRGAYHDPREFGYLIFSGKNPKHDA
jgi:hypothetical protein